MHTVESWTGELLIAHGHDIANDGSSEAHVARFKSKELGIRMLQDAFVLPCADASWKQESCVPTPHTACHRQRLGERTLIFDEGSMGPHAKFMERPSVRRCGPRVKPVTAQLKPDTISEAFQESIFLDITLRLEKSFTYLESHH